MNKYKEKILEIGKDADTIVELLRRKKMSKVEKVVDFVFTNSMTVVDGLNVDGQYYLLIKDKVSKLVHISKEFKIEEFDVSNEVENSSNNKVFEYKGNFYKIFKKIR